MVLTHAGAIDEDLLRSGRRVVEEQGTVLDVEGSILLLGTSTASTLGLEASKDAALGGVEAVVLHTRSRVD